MLLASAPLREWSLLSSRPMSGVHDRSLRQGDPTGRTKLTDHVPRIHYHCLNPVARSSSIHPPTHSLASIDWLKTRAYQLKCQVARGTSNMISKSITHSFRRNAMPSAVEGYWITMTNTILSTTRQRSTRIVQSTTNLLVRVANWQSQIPSSGVTRT